MKTTSIWRSILVIITVFSFISCNSEEEEEVKPTPPNNPIEQTKFIIYNSSEKTSNGTITIDTLLTEDDIEWFNIDTREIKIRNEKESLWKKLAILELENEEGKLIFSIGKDTLFEVNRFVSNWDNQVFTDLVLHYSTVTEVDEKPHYYLHDYYPLQLNNDSRVQANIKKNAPRWESFINYFEGLGKIKREEPKKITSITMYLSLDDQKITLQFPDSDLSPFNFTSRTCIIDSIKVTTTGRISNVKFKGALIHLAVREFEATLHEQSYGVWTAVHRKNSDLLDPNDNLDFNLHLFDGGEFYGITFSPGGTLNELSFNIFADNYKIKKGPYTIYITTPPSDN